MVGHALRERMLLGPRRGGEKPEITHLRLRRYLCRCGAVVNVVSRGVGRRLRYRLSAMAAGLGWHPTTNRRMVTWADEAGAIIPRVPRSAPNDRVVAMPAARELVDIVAPADVYSEGSVSAGPWLSEFMRPFGAPKKRGLFTQHLKMAKPMVTLSQQDMQSLLNASRRRRDRFAMVSKWLRVRPAALTAAAGEPAWYSIRSGGRHAGWFWLAPASAVQIAEALRLSPAPLELRDAAGGGV